MTQQIQPFPIPKPGSISLLVAPKTISQTLMEMTAALALKGTVLVIDGGNRFDGYGLARALRRRTAQIQAALKQVWLSRTFTCYQMAAVLADLPLNNMPIIILDMLSTFYDENIPLTKRQCLLNNSLNHLNQISQHAPVAIWARPDGTPNASSSDFLTALLERAHEIWELESLPPPAHQLPLF